MLRRPAIVITSVSGSTESGIDPSPHRRDRFHSRFERSGVLEHPPTRNAGRNRQQSGERSIVTREGRVRQIAEIAAWAHQPWSRWQLDTVPDPVVAGVVDHPAVGRFDAIGVADPVGGRRPAATGVHDQIDLELGITEADRRHSVTVDSDTTRGDAVVHLGCAARRGRHAGAPTRSAGGALPCIGDRRRQGGLSRKLGTEIDVRGACFDQARRTHRAGADEAPPGRAE